MAALDQHLFFRINEAAYLDLLTYKPKRVLVMDILQPESHDPVIEVKSLDPAQLVTWLEKKPHPSENSQITIQGTLRLILGACPAHPLSPESLPISFPADRSNIIGPRNIPFSRPHFELVIEKFGLPRSTPWLCYSSSQHFQTYCLESSGSPPRGGITLRASNRGILAMDMSLSLSYCPSTRVTNALLLGHSEEQVAFIQHQLIQLAPIASHPALLPTLVYTYTRSLLQRLIDREVGNLYRVEAESGHTFVAIFDDRGPIPLGNSSDEVTSKKALGIIQLVTAWECFTKGLLFEIDSVQQFIKDFDGTTTDDNLRACGSILAERLRFLSQKGNTMLFTAQFTKERASAQVTAVYNFIAQRGNEFSHKIAVASQHDSSVMKSIALLTMTFLPATFLATFFATPFIAISKPAQWIYWSITLPVTFLVLLLWTLWDRLGRLYWKKGQA